MIDLPQDIHHETLIYREESSRFLTQEGVGYEIASAPAPKKAVSSMLQGQCVYLDMGLLYSYVVTHFVQWWPEPVQIQQDQLDAYLQSFFASLKNEGVNKVDLAFAQLSDIDALLAGKGGSPTDTIGQILKDGYPVGSTGMNFLRYFTQAAHQNQIKVVLSFGGLNANGADWTLGGAPAAQAMHLQQLMAQYKFDSVDWDIEGAGVGFLMGNNKPADVLTFFNTLHTLLGSDKKLSILTLAGSLQDGPAGPLTILFKNFKQNFDGVNLMLYSNTEYYIDAENPAWGLKEWLEYVKDPQMLRVGFYDQVPYENPDASAGFRYPVPPGLTRGQAAAFIYSYVLKELGFSLQQFGQPFWWTDQPTALPADQTIQDFWNMLSRLSKLKDRKDRRSGRGAR